MTKKVSKKEETVIETTAEEVAQVILTAGLMTCLHEQLKAMPDVWQRMNEKQQQDVIDRAHRQVVKAAQQACLTIAAQGRTFVAAQVDQVVFKDGVKAVLVGKGPAFHEIADAVGGMVLIVMPGIEASLDEAHGVKPEKNQASLPLA